MSYWRKEILHITITLLWSNLDRFSLGSQHCQYLKCVKKHCEKMWIFFLIFYSCKYFYESLSYKLLITIPEAFFLSLEIVWRKIIRISENKKFPTFIETLQNQNWPVAARMIQKNFFFMFKIMHVSGDL